MRIWLFDIGEQAVINQHALHGLPDRIGSLVEITEQIEHGSYDYRVRLDDNTYTRVKEKELNKVNKDDVLMRIKVGDSVVKLNGEEAKIQLIDYLYEQIEILFADGSYEVIDKKVFINETE